MLFLSASLSEGKCHQAGIGPGRATAFGSRGLQLAYAELEKVVAELVTKGKRVVLVMPIPVGEFNDPRTLPARRFGDLSFRVVNRPIDRREFDAQFAPVLEHLNGVAQRTGATIIDPVSTLCSADTCPTVDEHGEPVYRDSGHLRAAFIRDHATWLDAILLPQ
ncbi:MAG: SGNH hydrolase domain-containing protein [Steroidobacteraceae bacterium]